MLNFFVKFRIPLTLTEFLDMVKEVLDEVNFVSEKFKDNRPGINRLTLFRKRHSLSLRLADNLKNGRALVGPMTINVSFFLSIVYSCA